MKTRTVIANERLTAWRNSPKVFDQYPLSKVRTHNVISSEAGIFSRDGPSPRCK